MDTDLPAARHTCLKLHVGDGEGADTVVFVKGTWFPTRFQLSITDGLDTWVCDATDAEVRQRAEQWDQSVSEYTAMAERYLGFQQPGSVYRFEDAGNGQKRLSWTFEKLGTGLEWRWKCQPSPNNKQTALEIFDFLMDANIRLSDLKKYYPVWSSPPVDVCKLKSWKQIKDNGFGDFGPLIIFSTTNRHTNPCDVTRLRDLWEQLVMIHYMYRNPEEVISIKQSFDKLKLEAEKCLSQSEKFSKEKLEFESSVYAKFVEVLNSKKAKLREHRARSQNTDKGPQEEEDSSEKTETFDEASADELNK